MHTAEPWVPDLLLLKVEIVIENVKTYSLPDIYQILLALIYAEGNKLCYEIHKLLNSLWNEDKFPE
jgi:hypothetical protein